MGGGCAVEHGSRSAGAGAFPLIAVGMLGGAFLAGARGVGIDQVSDRCRITCSGWVGSCIGRGAFSVRIDDTRGQDKTRAGFPS